ncbi:MAG: hypothetical protein E7040_08910 [Lentisphaerae bacterium]|nr:hypothetical protein [Lentisphaerota bacterium]
MKYNIVPAAAALFLGASVFAGSPSAPYDNTRIDARLNVTVKEDTKVVHFVRDNADPNVITKAYIIKHVDPYELRSYLRNVVQTRKVNDNNTNIEAVRYTDGTSVLLISAEDYRFEDTPNAQGFDSIVKELDKPKLISSSGRHTYVYSPKYRSSADLLEMISNVGLYSKNAVMNNVGGTDVVAEDPGLNLLFFCTAPFSRRTIMDLLEEYDQPTPSVRAKVTVYELYAENDTKLGFDFQAWKNNDGINFFSGGGRYSRNYAGNVLNNAADWNDVSYFQFNPKWNTKYIDFLTSKGKAKVLHTSEMNLLNNTTGAIDKYTQIFVAKSTPVGDYEIGTNYCNIYADPEVTLAEDGKGRPITVSENANVTIFRFQKDGYVEYRLRLDKNNKATFYYDGKDTGAKVINAEKINMIYLNAFNDKTIGHPSGNKIETEAADKKIGFAIRMTPSINKKATTLRVRIGNTSLIGYTSDGSPRIQQGAKIDTEFMISNEGTKLVIGGIEKRSVVSVSGGVPFLKDLPFIGWIFSTETEATKRSQLLVVAEIVPEKKAENYKSVFEAAQKKLLKAGVSNTYGYRQFFLDPERLQK